jgi:glycosyltransferase involved in cell wall biosynthesis
VRVDRRDDRLDGPRVAIAHDYLTQCGGAERVVLSMSRAFPDAPIYTLLYNPATTYPEFADRDIRVSGLNKVSPLRKNHRPALPVLPFAAESIFIDADVVLTSTSGWAHGFRTRGRKLVYCHSPARWLYLPDTYLGDHGGLLNRAALLATSGLLRAWDRRATRSCDRYLAVSSLIKTRISDVYGIDADVLPPPVAMKSSDAVAPVPEVQQWIGGDATDSFFLVVSRLLPYKNVDAIVQAFAGSDRRLVVVGRGPEAPRIQRMMTPNVLMVSDLSDAQMAWLYRSCRAIIAASYEDFGLTPVEAGVWGRPTVALRWGGFLDTVHEGVSGIYFDEPRPRSIAAALNQFDDTSFDPDKIQRHVAQFTEERFIQSLYAAVDELAAPSCQSAAT